MTSNLCRLTNIPKLEAWAKRQICTFWLLSLTNRIYLRAPTTPACFIHRRRGTASLVWVSPWLCNSIWWNGPCGLQLPCSAVTTTRRRPDLTDRPSVPHRIWVFSIILYRIGLYSNMLKCSLMYMGFMTNDKRKTSASRLTIKLSCRHHLVFLCNVLTVVSVCFL